MGLLSVGLQIARGTLMRPSTPHLSEDSLTQIAASVARWLASASNSSNNSGVSARYDLRKNSWQTPYPETSGYIIPSLLDYSSLNDETFFRDLAIQTGQYLVGLQSSDGAIDCRRAGAGYFREGQRHVAFDLGAILTGLTEIAKTERAFVEPALRLGGFLAREQSSDGGWNHMQYFEQFGTHNTLVAAALMKAGTTFQVPDFEKAANRTLQMLQHRIHSDGFIEGCGFGDDENRKTFIHPFCYAIEGFQTANALGVTQNFSIEASLDRLATYVQERPLPASHFDRDFIPTSWYCAVTGAAQSSLVLLRSSKIGHQEVGRRLFRRLAKVIDTTAKRPGVRGGVPSSWPLYGGYGKFTYNNWGAKYFLDAYLELCRLKDK